MKVVVIGGSGLIGSKLVAVLRERGYDAVAASPASGAGELGAGRCYAPCHLARAQYAGVVALAKSRPGRQRP